MRIATFNLEDFPSDSPDAVSVEERIAALRPQMLRLDADVLCLQEVNADRLRPGLARGFHALDRLFEGTPYASYSWTATTIGSPPEFADKHNLVTLSRRPIRFTEQVRNSIIPEQRHRFVTAGAGAETTVGWDRPALYSVIDLGGDRRLHLVNLHLRAPLAVPIEGQKLRPFVWKSVGGWAEGFYLAGLRRSGQALEVRLLVERILVDERDALIAVCGDFNADVDEVPVRILRADREDTGNGALAAHMLVPVDRSLPKSRRFSVLHAGRQLMLDHVLASRALLALSRDVEVHNEALGDELVAFATGARGPDSFHAPVVAEFDLGGGRA
jgi:endonuclease/exonuclease/phosphatase family metal-dependent hydrolase